MSLPTVGEYLDWQGKDLKLEWFKWVLENELTQDEESYLLEFDFNYEFAKEAMLALAEN